MIIFADPLNTDFGHVSFNATAIEAVLEATDVPCAELVCYSDHAEAIKKLWGHRSRGLRLQFTAVDPIVSHARLLRNIARARIIRHLISRVNRLQPSTIVLLASDNIVVPALVRLLSGSSSRAASWYVVVHNNLAAAEARKRYPTTLWPLAQKTLNIKAITLFQTLDVGVVSRLLGINQSCCIPFPTRSDQTSIRDHPGKRDACARVAILGRHARLFVDGGILGRLAKRSVETRADLRIELLLAHEPVSHTLGPKWNVTFLGDGHLSEEDYWEVLAECDYVLLLDQDQNRPSGLLMDAIATGTPVLAHQSGHALALHRSIASGLGGLFYESDHQLGGLMEAAALLPRFAYRAMVETNRELAQLFSLSATVQRIQNLTCLSD